MLTPNALFLCVLLSVGHYPANSQSCGPAVEEGESMSISCRIRSTHKCQSRMATWYVVEPGDEQPMCIEGPECPQNGQRVSGFESSPRILSNVSVESNLTIHNVSRSSDMYTQQSKWMCKTCEEEHVARDRMEIYSRPRGVECNMHYLTDEAGVIQGTNVNCSISRVFPRPECQFTAVSATKTEQLRQTPMYNHKETENDPIYDSSQCSLLISATSLEPGRHQFDVLVYPDITGGQSYGVNVRATLIETPPPAPTPSPEPMDNRNMMMMMTVVLVIVPVFIIATCAIIRVKGLPDKCRRRRRPVVTDVLLSSHILLMCPSNPILTLRIALILSHTDVLLSSHILLMCPSNPILTLRIALILSHTNVSL
ncbi:hypothetical protein PoB_003619100 [Plakobranchus ocellatus]|uniref:Ig-like domain-containing protein n=1 Tax=Plakobranchus ocellatus TaxID=259542 RepID=A0AAV4AEQ6_9GAST|nr:hypothetical protein PoB_003619100 [Plakobranchus ocellatus]